MAEKKAAAKKKASSAKKATPAKKAAAGAKKTSAKKRAKSATRAQPTHEEIARRAYEIHEREGGHHEENWLRAERELKAD